MGILTNDGFHRSIDAALQVHRSAVTEGRSKRLQGTLSALPPHVVKSCK